MNKECQDYLNLRVKPNLVGALEASWVLGVHLDWIAILVSGWLLPVAGGHRPGCQFYFSYPTLARLAEDPEWANKAVGCARKVLNKKNRAGQLSRSSCNGGTVVLTGGYNA